MPDTITYKAKGQVYEIPDTERDVFLQDFPDAMEVESFLIGRDTFDIPTAEVSGFLQEKPEAKPLKKKTIRSFLRWLRQKLGQSV